MRVLALILFLSLAACGETTQASCTTVACALDQGSYFGTVSVGDFGAALGDPSSVIKDTLPSNDRAQTLGDAWSIMKAARTQEAEVVAEFYAPVGPGGDGMVARAHLFPGQVIPETAEAGWAAYCTYGFGCP